MPRKGKLDRSAVPALLMWAPENTINTQNRVSAAIERLIGEGVTVTGGVFAALVDLERLAREAKEKGLE